ncbi:MAG: hypothetical protein ACRBK7_32745 [Acidimicrobiales bacterium]
MTAHHRSAATARVLTGPAQKRRTSTSTGTSTRPKLKVLNQEAIRQRARRRNALFVLFNIVLVGFFAVAFVHANLVAGQQDLDGVRTRIAEAEAHRAKVARAVEEASAPAIIVSRAEALGMVRAHQPVYLQAVSPVRELPTVATFVPSGPPAHLDVAAGVSKAASNISAGVSADTSVALTVSTSESEVVAIAPAQTAATPAPEETPVQTQAPTTAAPRVTIEPPAETGIITSTGGAFGGVAVSTSDSSAAASARSGVTATANQPPPQVSAASTQATSQTAQAPGAGVSGTSIQQTQSSFAGSRAVSGGQGSG